MGFLYNLGPMNTYKPMHLLFGYSIPMEKIAMLLFMLIGVTMIYFGTGSVQMSKNGLQELLVEFLSV